MRVSWMGRRLGHFVTFSEVEAERYRFHPMMLIGDEPQSYPIIANQNGIEFTLRYVVDYKARLIDQGSAVYTLP